MKTYFFAVALWLGSAYTHAQQPMNPPAGDLPSPAPSEGRKGGVPSSHKKTKQALPHVTPKKPPVVPPTPEKTAPDQAPTIE